MAEIKLTNAHETWTVVDDDLMERLSVNRWHLHSLGYAAGYVDGKIRKLHRVVMGEPVGLMVDHINGNKLDNRRSNLRICTASQNASNRPKERKSSRSQYKGVMFESNTGRWRASISHNRYDASFGPYETDIEAAMAYNTIATALKGGFARVNDGIGFAKMTDDMLWFVERVRNAAQVDKLAAIVGVAKSRPDLWWPELAAAFADLESN